MRIGDLRVGSEIISDNDVSRTAEHRRLRTHIQRFGATRMSPTITPRILGELIGSADLEVEFRARLALVGLGVARTKAPLPCDGDAYRNRSAMTPSVRNISICR